MVRPLTPAPLPNEYIGERGARDLGAIVDLGDLPTHIQPGEIVVGTAERFARTLKKPWLTSFGRYDEGTVAMAIRLLC